MTDKSIIIYSQILFLYDERQAEIPYSSKHLFPRFRFSAGESAGEIIVIPSFLINADT